MHTLTETAPASVFIRLVAPARRVIAWLDTLSPLADLVLRLWVAHAFFIAGLTKIQSWETTVLLFTYEYHVPLLPPEIAALLGAATELCFPVLLTLGLATRFGAAVLFVFNIIAVISYPDLGEVGLRDHQVWGLMLLVILLHGPGKLSLDHLVARTLRRVS
jgi:putative oxidoreductase